MIPLGSQGEMYPYQLPETTVVGPKHDIEALLLQAYERLFDDGLQSLTYLKQRLLEAKQTRRAGELRSITNALRVMVNSHKSKYK